jgi:hypothetical protein
MSADGYQRACIGAHGPFAGREIARSGNQQAIAGGSSRFDCGDSGVHSVAGGSGRGPQSGFTAGMAERPRNIRSTYGSGSTRRGLGDGPESLGRRCRNLSDAGSGAA